MNKLKSQQGLTLVEVLAALVILGIVFVGIMTVFPQMTLFNNKTEAKLDTMNLARQEMANITEEAWEVDLLGTQLKNNTELNKEVVNKMNIFGYTEKVGNANYFRFEKQNTESAYVYEVDIWKTCTDFLDEKNIENACLFDAETSTRLNQVHLKIFNGSSVSSETYSYVKFIQENK